MMFLMLTTLESHAHNHHLVEKFDFLSLLVAGFDSRIFRVYDFINVDDGYMKKLKIKKVI